MFSAYPLDVIARCAFGLKIDTLGNKNDPFIENSRFFFNPPTNKTPAILLPCKSPSGDYFIIFHKSLEIFSTFFIRILQTNAPK
jgi:cytochrome P450 family 3 subfamily A